MFFHQIPLPNGARNRAGSGGLPLRWVHAAGGPEEMPANDTIPPEGVSLLLQRLDRIAATLAALLGGNVSPTPGGAFPQTARGNQKGLRLYSS
jgi:hypothetical protein